MINSAHIIFFFFVSAFAVSDTAAVDGQSIFKSLIPKQFLTSIFKVNYLNVHDVNLQPYCHLLSRRVRVHERSRVQGVQRLYEKRSEEKNCCARNSAMVSRDASRKWSGEKSLLRSSAMSCCGFFLLLPRLLIQHNALFA